MNNAGRGVVGEKGVMQGAKMQRPRFDFLHASDGAMAAIPPSSAGQALAPDRKAPSLPIRRAISSTADLQASSASNASLDSPRGLKQQPLLRSADKPSSSFFLGAFTSLTRTLTSKSLEAAKVSNRQEDRRSALEGGTIRQAISCSMPSASATSGSGLTLQQCSSSYSSSSSSILAPTATAATDIVMGSPRRQAFSSAAAVGSPRHRSSLTLPMVSPRHGKFRGIMPVVE